MSNAELAALLPPYYAKWVSEQEADERENEGIPYLDANGEVRED